jgi:hypothetical protein
MVQGANNDTAGIIQKQVIVCYNFAWLSDEKSYNKAFKNMVLYIAPPWVCIRQKCRRKYN